MALAETLLSLIQAERASRFAALQLPSDWIAPNYGGRSIVNVPASIAQLFGAQPHAAPLDPRILEGLGDGAQRVVLVIVDALGYAMLRDALAANPHNGFQPLLQNGARLLPLTSVFPSTTTAALTSLWCGYTPAEHGSLGYQMFLREYGVRANMIEFSPVATEKQQKGQLVAAGLAPEKFLPVPSLPQTLEKVGVPVYNLIEKNYVNSPLSRMQIRGQRETRGFIAASDMWVSLRHWLAEKRHERALFVAYWSALDTIAHQHGPSSEMARAEINHFAYACAHEFLQKLTLASAGGTLFLLTADHGQIDTPMARALRLRDEAGLQPHLLMAFSGEPRAAYLYCNQGELEAARRYLENERREIFFVLRSRAALEAGLFGGAPSPATRERIGDLLVLPRDDYSLWDGDQPPPLLGKHGGLSAAEMLVPLLAARLD